MRIEFATCERQRALTYIKQSYPGYIITDTPDSAGPLLDFVEQDIVRIQDPLMYGKSIEVVPGKKWSEGERQRVIACCEVFTKTMKEGM